MLRSIFMPSEKETLEIQWNLKKLSEQLRKAIEAYHYASGTQDDKSFIKGRAQVQSDKCIQMILEELNKLPSDPNVQNFVTQFKKFNLHSYTDSQLMHSTTLKTFNSTVAGFASVQEEINEKAAAIRTIDFQIREINVIKTLSPKEEIRGNQAHHLDAISQVMDKSVDHAEEAMFWLQSVSSKAESSIKKLQKERRALTGEKEPSFFKRVKNMLSGFFGGGNKTAAGEAKPVTQSSSKAVLGAPAPTPIAIESEEGKKTIEALLGITGKKATSNSPKNDISVLQANRELNIAASKYEKAIQSHETLIRQNAPSNNVTKSAADMASAGREYKNIHDLYTKETIVEDSHTDKLVELLNQHHSVVHGTAHEMFKKSDEVAEKVAELPACHI